jgi:hypothetical protein
MAQCLSLKISHNQIIRPILYGEIVQNNQKPVYFFAVFFHFGANWAAQNEPKKVPKGQKVSRMYCPMPKLKHKPLTKSLGPFLKEKLYETTRKQVFMLFFIFGPLGTPKWTQKHNQRLTSRQNVWPNV